MKRNHLFFIAYALLPFVSHLDIMKSKSLLVSSGWLGQNSLSILRVGGKSCYTFQNLMV